MPAQFWTAAVALGGPALAFLTFIIGRRSTAGNEKTNSISGAIEAVTEANVSITAMVTSLMEPMQTEIDRMRTVETELRDELNHVKTRQNLMDQRFTKAIEYIQTLHRLIQREGLKLPEVPPELDGIDLHGY